MQFIILHVDQQEQSTYITGCFARVSPDSEEREIFEALTGCIDEVNRKSFRADCIVRKDNTIYFKCIESRALFTALKYWNDNLPLNLSIKVNSHVVFTGKNAKQAFEQIMNALDLPLSK